ncbi:MAG: ATP-binding cassette domain-containing protein [Defluviitaleaceae bacterium]|nr:ATP-binding cassette domain-containing protein [Defluviitaleaceae bacterium]MCL2262296.1 ATP-binding cassette domain-containing protein [Defluviitaleaceae bacterium]
MIEVKGINQSYHRDGSNLILKNVNLQIRDKLITALVGANGAGKSTLLGVMANNIKPVSGNVLLDGTDVTKIKTKEIAKKIAFLRQTHHISIKITVNDLIEYGRFPHSGGRLTDACKKAVNDALEYMELTDLRDSFLSEISGGQRQRAFIAMILAQDTPYIFLDEPLNNLDVRFSVDMMKIVQRLVAELGKTVIVVLHDINFAAAYAGHIVAMKDGEIHAEGSPTEIITPDVLNPVFDHDFYITHENGKPVCLCYDAP